MLLKDKVAVVYRPQSTPKSADAIAQRWALAGAGILGPGVDRRHR